MLTTSLAKTPMAALSRPVAGTIGKTLIITLPGSVKAVRENLDAIFASGAVFHAIDLIRGGTGRQVHQEMAKGQSIQVDSRGYATNVHEHAHHHHHQHNSHGHATPKPRTLLSNDPSLPGIVQSPWCYSLLSNLSVCSTARIAVPTLYSQ